MPFPIRLATAILSAILFALPHTTRAQETPPLTQRTPEPLSNLDAALRHIAWNPHRQGVLLAIAPDRVPADIDRYDSSLPDQDTRDEADARPLYPPADRYGLNAALVARHFRQNLIHFPTMTVFAPSTMVTLSHDLKPPNPYLNMPAADRMRSLFATFTQEQWKLLTTPNGVGVGDLNREQEPIFEALVPEGCQLLRDQSQLKTDPYRFGREGEEPSTTDITATQRHGLRLRLDRYVTATLDRPDSASPDALNDFMDTPFHTAPYGTLETSLFEKLTTYRDDSYVYGQQVRFQTPNRLKPGDLDLKSPKLDVWVPIVSAATVGDLIHALRRSTGLDLYADYRFARLPVTITGGDAPQVRAADLLEALCWAVCGTFRQVGLADSHSRDIAYVLTFDRAGIAVLRGHIRQLDERGEEARKKMNVDLAAKFKGQRPDKTAVYLKDNLLNPGPEVEKQLTGEADSDLASASVPFSMLTVEQRHQLDNWIARNDQWHKAHPEDTHPPLDLTGYKVTFDTSVDVTFLLPGGDAIDSGTGWNQLVQVGLMDWAEWLLAPHVPETATTPVAGNDVIVVAALPCDRSEAEGLIAAAAARGVKQLWLRLPDTVSTTTRLTDCIIAGAAHHLPIGAILSLSALPESGLPPTWQTVNLYGETGSQFASRLAAAPDYVHLAQVLGESRHKTDWMNPRLPEVLAYQQRRIDAVASTPGLAALALSDSAVPGYYGSVSNDTGGYGFGYTTENRLSFLRRFGADPIDLDDNNDAKATAQAITLPLIDERQVYDISKPDAPSENAVMIKQWQDFLGKQQIVALNTLRRHAHTNWPDLSCFLESDEAGAVVDGYNPWELQQPTASQTANTIAYPTVRYYRGMLAYLQTAHPEDTRTLTETGLIAAGLRETLNPKPTDPPTLLPTTAFLDLSTFPISEAIPLIKGAFLPISAVADHIDLAMPGKLQIEASGGDSLRIITLANTKP